MPTGNIIGGTGTRRRQRDRIQRKRRNRGAARRGRKPNPARNILRDNHANGGLGIDLGGDRATPNDLGDADTGPNLLHESAGDPERGLGAASGTVLTGRIDTTNPTSVVIDSYSNPAPGPGEVVEAANYLGTAVPAGDGSFAIVFPIQTLGLAITAIATDCRRQQLGDQRSAGLRAVALEQSWSALAGTHGLATLNGAGTLAGNTQMGLLLSGAQPGRRGASSRGLRR